MIPDTLGIIAGLYLNWRVSSNLVYKEINLIYEIAYLN